MKPELSSKTTTYAEIADSFPLWQQYADPSGIDSEDYFHSQTTEEKIAFLVACFGPES